MIRGKRWISSLLIGFGCMAMALHLPAQEVGTKLKRNMVGLTFSLHEYFDGSPMIQPPTSGTIGWLNLGFGLEYQRNIAGRHGILASTTVASAHYWFGEYPTEMGDVFERVGLLVGCEYLFNVLPSSKVNVHALGGGSFRYGHELVLLGRIGQEPFLYDYGLRDLGLSTGLRINYCPFWKLVFSSELKLTQYIYRSANHEDQLYHFKNRPTPSMLTMQVEIGYQF